MKGDGGGGADQHQSQEREKIQLLLEFGVVRKGQWPPNAHLVETGLVEGLGAPGVLALLVRDLGVEAVRVANPARHVDLLRNGNPQSLTNSAPIAHGFPGMLGNGSLEAKNAQSLLDGTHELEVT